MRRVRKALYNLGFAALLGLGTIPSMIAIHLLAQDSSPALCLKERLSDDEKAKNLAVKHYSLPLSE